MQNIKDAAFSPPIIHFASSGGTARVYPLVSTFFKITMENNEIKHPLSYGFFFKLLMRVILTTIIFASFFKSILSPRFYEKKNNKKIHFYFNENKSFSKKNT